MMSPHVLKSCGGCRWWMYCNGGTHNGPPTCTHTYYTHLHPHKAHPLQTHHSLVHDVMLSDPSSAASPSFVLLTLSFCSLSPHSIVGSFLYLLEQRWLLTHTRIHSHSHTLTQTLPGDSTVTSTSIRSTWLLSSTVGGESLVSFSFLWWQQEIMAHCKTKGCWSFRGG